MPMRACVQPPSGTFVYKLDRVKRPRGMAVDGKFLYVADEVSHAIRAYLKHDGSFAGKWSSEGKEQGQLKEPWGTAVDEHHVYVSDANSRLCVFRKTAG